MEAQDHHRVLVTFKKVVLMAGYAARAFAKIAGLTPARLDLMLALQFEPALQRDLARDLAVTPPVVSRMLGALEELGLVVRHALVEDRRQRVVELTDWGRAKLGILFDGFFVDDGSATAQSDAENRFVDDYEQDLKEGGLHIAQLPNVHNRSILWRMLHAVRNTKYYTDDEFGPPDVYIAGHG